MTPLLLLGMFQTLLFISYSNTLDSHYSVNDLPRIETLLSPASWAGNLHLKTIN